MILIVETLTKKTYTIYVNPTDTVLDVKKFIRSQGGMPEDIQGLIYEGKGMNDNMTLSEYNIQNNSTLIVAHRLRGD